MNDVVWKPIPSFPRYEASSEGRVRRIGRARPLAICPSGNGYDNYRLTRDGKILNVSGHVAICEAFHGPKPSAAHEVAHERGDKADRSPERLRWATRTENMADKRLHGTHRSGERIPWARLKASDIPDIRTRLALGEAVSSIAADKGVSNGAINGIKIGRNWKDF